MTFDTASCATIPTDASVRKRTVVERVGGEIWTSGIGTPVVLFDDRRLKSNVVAGTL